MVKDNWTVCEILGQNVIQAYYIWSDYIQKQTQKINLCSFHAVVNYVGFQV